jgi:hypothetical protein
MKLRMRLLATALPLVAASLAETNAVSAATFTYSSYSVPGEQTIQTTSPANIYSGMGQIDLNGSAPSSAGVTISAWCLDVYTTLLGNGYGGAGPFTYNISQLTPLTSATGFGTSDASPASEIGQLTATQIAEIGGLIQYGNNNVSQSNVSAATQLAIWEIEYGQYFQFTGVSTATQNQATLEISELGGIIGLDSNVALLTAITGETNQTLAYDFNPPDPPNPTPLPATLPLFATGIGGLGLLGWRRKRKAQAIA